MRVDIMSRHYPAGNRGGLNRGQEAPDGMNCLSQARKIPVRGKIKRADSTLTTQTKECNEKVQLPSMGESRSAELETQKDEQNVIAGMPDTRIPMMTNRMRCFLVIVIIGSPLYRQCFETASKHSLLYPQCGTIARLFLIWR